MRQKNVAYAEGRKERCEDSSSGGTDRPWLMLRGPRKALPWASEKGGFASWTDTVYPYSIADACRASGWRASMAARGSTGLHIEGRAPRRRRAREMYLPQVCFAAPPPRVRGIGRRPAGAACWFRPTLTSHTSASARRRPGAPRAWRRGVAQAGLVRRHQRASRKRSGIPPGAEFLRVRSAPGIELRGPQASWVWQSRRCLPAGLRASCLRVCVHPACGTVSCRRAGLRGAEHLSGCGMAPACGLRPVAQGDGAGGFQSQDVPG